MKRNGLQQHAAPVPAASCDNMTLGRPRSSPPSLKHFLTGFSKFHVDAFG